MRDFNFEKTRTRHSIVFLFLLPALLFSGLNSQAQAFERSPADLFKRLEKDVDELAKISPAPAVIQTWKSFGWRAKDQEGNTYLHWAAEFGVKPEIVLFLLSQGLNPNCKNHLGQTALHKAAVRGHTSLVRLLLDQGADPRVQDRAGVGFDSVSKTWSGGSLEIRDLLNQRLSRVDGGENVKTTSALPLSSGH